jgi:hypothetical protein
MTLGKHGGALFATAKAEVNGRSRDVTAEQVRLTGNIISFVENLNFSGNETRIEYEGQIQGDTILFSRRVGDFATENATAKKSQSVDGSVTENSKEASGV